MTLDPNRPDTKPDMNRTDMNQPYTNRPVKRQDETPWGWILGGAAALIVGGVVVWSVMDDGTTKTAATNAPAISESAPATTGSGSGSSSGALPATTGSAPTGSAPSAPLPTVVPNPETKGAAQ